MGSTTLEPGESTDLEVSIHMGRGMGGMHVFEITVPSSDPEATANKLTVRVNYLE